MGNGYRKVNTNVYFKARKQAAEYDDRLSSREGASELIGVSESTLADYELGGTKVVPVDKVCLMAEYYHSPELKNWYCKNECPIGKDLPIATENKGIEGVVLKLLQEFSSERMKEFLDTLIGIAQDGEVTENEIGALRMTNEWASAMEMALSQFRISSEKIMGDRQ